MSAKRYYWLKLNESFFEDDTIAWLEEQENGKDYVIFYLKLALKSLQNDGHLIRYVGEKLMPYDVKALSKATNTPLDTVAVAMKVFSEIGLVTILETGEIYLTQINEMVGSETDSAKRVRKHRIRNQPEDVKALQCNIDVTKCNTEIEKEIDIEREKKEDKDNKLYTRVIDHLNLVAGTRYKPSSKATQRVISARINEGFTIEDIIKVIEIKADDWKGTEFEKYLRPETLFGTKFEGYLNSRKAEEKPKVQFLNIGDDE